MKLRSSLLATAAIAASLIVAGCGDDDEPQPATSETSGATGATGTSGPLSKSGFVKAADAICEEGEGSEQDQLAELFPDVQDPDDLSPAQYEELATEIVVPSLQSQLDQIRELTPPEGDEDEIDAITSALEDGIGEIEDDPAILSQGAGPPGLTEASTLAIDYGLKECGS